MSASHLAPPDARCRIPTSPPSNVITAWLAELDDLGRRADDLVADTKRVVIATRTAIRQARALLTGPPSDSPLLVPDPASPAVAP